jgi:hypothetical protein
LGFANARDALSTAHAYVVAQPAARFGPAPGVALGVTSEEDDEYVMAEEVDADATEVRVGTSEENVLMLDTAAEDEDDAGKPLVRENVAELADTLDVVPTGVETETPDVDGKATEDEDGVTDDGVVIIVEEVDDGTLNEEADVTTEDKDVTGSVETAIIELELKTGADDDKVVSADEVALLRGDAGADVATEDVARNEVEGTDDEIVDDGITGATEVVEEPTVRVTVCV